MHLVGMSMGAIGVLTAANRDADITRDALLVAGIPAMNLLKYDDRPTDAVKVGTVKQAKGLEFKQVVLARVKPSC